MEFGMWAYPWDLVDEGPKTVEERLVEMGIDRLYLATNYHTVEAFNPHNPVRKTVFADAGSYFRPQEGYGDLAPAPCENMEGDDWVEEALNPIRDSELEISGWIVGCHSSTLGMRQSEFALKTPFGDPLVFGLCPSQPAVQNYLLTMVNEMDERFAFDDSLLETFHYFHGSGWGWHHQKFHADIGDLGEYLLGLCFCDECRSRAADRGVDVERASETCREAIVQLAEGDMDSGVEPAEWVDGHSSVKAYSDVRQETLNDLYERLSAETEMGLGAFVGMVGVDNSWMHGLDLETLPDHLDYFTAMSYREEAAEAVDVYQRSDERTGSVPVRAGVLPGHPMIHDGQSVQEHVRALTQAGADEITFYNYGLLPERNLEWIQSAIDTVQ